MFSKAEAKQLFKPLQQHYSTKENFPKVPVIGNISRFII